MYPKSYGRRRLPSYSAIASTLALVFSLAALCVGGAMATGVIVTSKQIKNGSILSQDIHKSAVKSSDIGTNAVGSSDIASNAVQSPDIADGQVGSADIGTGQVTSSDIGNGDVTPEDVTMPEPEQFQEADTASAEVSNSAGLVDVVDTYAKEDPTSVLEVDWSGTAAAGFSSCVFQLRVDGHPSAANAGELFVSNGATTSVSVSALFDGLSTGPHQIEIWARTVIPSTTYPCTVGPASAGIGQTFVISEQVV